MANTWMNSDGLYLKTGTQEAVLSTSGAYRNDGNYHVVEMTIHDMTDLGTAAAIQDDVTFLPKNARIEKLELVTETACTSGGSAVLNVGLQRRDRSTELDYDGLIAAAALSTFNAAGETVTFTAGSTAAGALVGTTLAYNGYLTADYDTAAFTAGKVVIRVFYRFPVTDAFVS